MIPYSAASPLVKELYDAVKAGDIRLAQDLLARGVSPNVFDSQGRTPLIIAAGADSEPPTEPATPPPSNSMVLALLAANADPDWRSFNDRTPLMHAAASGNASACAALLGAGAAADLQNREGRTALMQSAYELRENVVRLLIESGAQVNLADATGKTALDFVGLRTVNRLGVQTCRSLLEKADAKAGNGLTQRRFKALRRHFTLDEAVQYRRRPLNALMRRKRPAGVIAELVVAILAALVARSAMAGPWIFLGPSLSRWLGWILQQYTGTQRIAIAAVLLTTVAALIVRSAIARPHNAGFLILVSWLVLIPAMLVWRGSTAFELTAFAILTAQIIFVLANRTRLGLIRVTLLLWLVAFPSMVIWSNVAGRWIFFGLTLLLSLVAFPAVLQLPYVLLTRKSARKVEGQPAAVPDPELTSRDDDESIDYVSNFVRLGWNSLAQAAREGRNMRLPHTFSYLTSVALALSIPVAFFCAEAILQATWSTLLVTIFVVLLACWMLLAFWVEDYLRAQRLVAFQRQQDQIAAEIAKSMEEHLQDQTSEPGDFLLYLRTFGVTGKLGVGGIDLETAIAYNLDRMLPVVALGKPGEAFGAGRILTTDQHWKEEILQLIENAKLIMIIPSHHEGTLWEIGRLREGTYFDKTIFVMPPEIKLDGGWLSETWSQAVEAALGLRLFLPLHYPEGLMFKLDAAGQATEHAPFGAELFLAEMAVVDPGVHPDSHPNIDRDGDDDRDGDGDSGGSSGDDGSSSGDSSSGNDGTGGGDGSSGNDGTGGGDGSSGNDGTGGRDGDGSGRVDGSSS
jgi:uncharacterized membrane protein YgcG